MLSGQTPPKANAIGEQYSVAALLYLLATGHYHMEFNLEREAMLRQIAEPLPLRFENVGVEPWPELEAVLTRALDKRPDQRYSGMDAFADALQGIVVTPSPVEVVQDGASNKLLRDMLEYLKPNGILYTEGLPAGPMCSVNFGMAGIAYALYRLACTREDSNLLAVADIWITRAQRDQVRDDAFANLELEMTVEISGKVSPYHSSAGLQLVRALIAKAAGNMGECEVALTDFVSTSQQLCPNRDLALGRCGTVLGCALLLQNQLNDEAVPTDPLRALASNLLEEIWNEVNEFDSLENCGQWPNIGIAHGWAGLLYTTLRWHVCTGDKLPAGFTDRMTQLIDCTRPSGRGLIIPWRERPDEYNATMPGWCNGSSGLVHLGCLAYQVLGENEYLNLAEGLAWDTWEASGGLLADLCCGLAGRAYALMSWYRMSGEEVWLKRAKILAHQAACLAPDQRGRDHPRHSLYKGELGLTLLLADFERPENACMPLFEES